MLKSELLLLPHSWTTKNRHAETYLRHLLERENNDAIKKALLDALDVLRKEGR